MKHYTYTILVSACLYIYIYVCLNIYNTCILYTGISVYIYLYKIQSIHLSGKTELSFRGPYYRSTHHADERVHSHMHMPICVVSVVRQMPV